MYLSRLFLYRKNISSLDTNDKALLAYTLTAHPECSSPTSATGNGNLLVNIEPNEKRVLSAWFPFIFSFETNLKRVKWTNFYPDSLKYEGEYSFLPWKPAFKGQTPERPQINPILYPLCLKYQGKILISSTWP